MRHEKGRGSALELEGLEDRILNDALEGILVLDRAHRYRFWNPQMERITGMAKSEVLGKVAWDVFPFLRAVGLDALIDRALTGETVVSPDFEYKVPGTGKSGWSVQKMGPLRDRHGDVVGAMVFVEDITERKRGEETIARQLAEIGSYYDHAPVGLGVLSLDLRFLRINAALAAMSGVPAVDHIGRTVTEVVPLLAPLAREMTDEILKTGKPLVGRERSGELPGEPGVMRTWLKGCYPLRDETGAITAFTIIVEDVTERRRAERAERRHQAELAEAQKMEAIGSLAGGVAHDFNNLLTVILAQTDIALGVPPLSERVRDALVEIRDASKRAASLTRQLLAFGGKQALNPAPLDLNGVVMGLEKMVRGVLGEENALGLALASDLGLVVADAAQIEQVLVNLVLNARDAMPRGGRVTIETANVDVDEARARRLGLDVPGPHALLAVTDTGEGMDAATLARCFEPFYTTKPAGRGTGLGLSTARGIVRQSGGAIEVTTEPGRGARFEVLLPRVEGAEVAPPEPLEAAVRARGETVLVVEDERAILAAVAAILGQAGYFVLTAPSGQDALRVADDFREQIHLVVSDVVMPGIDGPTMVERLKKTRPSTRVLFVSGYPERVARARAVLDAGARLLPKPFASAELLKKVREVLDA